MAHFDHAFGQGPEGPTYRPPVPQRRTVVDHLRGWLWYRWGIGQRPLPKFEQRRDG